MQKQSAIYALLLTIRKLKQTTLHCVNNIHQTHHTIHFARALARFFTIAAMGIIFSTALVEPIRPNQYQPGADADCSRSKAVRWFQQCNLPLQCSPEEQFLGKFCMCICFGIKSMLSVLDLPPRIYRVLWWKELVSTSRARIRISQML